ncbi:MAG: NnrS family protein [Alphaproteobacteria bacterium]
MAIHPTKGIPRYRPYGGPALLAQGFRPFFLAAGCWAALAMLVWLPVFLGAVALPAGFDPVGWHAHEMLFGYAVCAIAGFLLTAIPNWTGRMPLQGLPLAALFALWLAGRAAMAVSSAIGPIATAILDLAFLAGLLLVVLREIVAGRNWRNLPVAAAIALLLLANALTHAEAGGYVAAGGAGQRLGIAVVTLLIGLIGGRIVPSFTRNWLARRGEERLPASAGGTDSAALACLVAGLAAWVVAPATQAAGATLLLAAAATALRLVRWRGELTAAEPLVWSLHIGFAWVVAGLALLGLGILTMAVPAGAGIHALTAGAVGAMTLAVMTRATRGHTGHALAADGWTTAIYIAVNAAAAARVAAALLPGAYTALLHVAALLWIAAFGLFVVRYAPMLLRPHTSNG